MERWKAPAARWITALALLAGVPGAADGWRPVVHDPGPHHNPTLVYDSWRARLVMFGGPWEWNGVRWTPGPPVPPALADRGGASAVFDSWRGVMVVHGGTDSFGVRQADTWHYDGRSWSRGNDAPQAEDAALGFDAARGVAVRAGATTWEYDGAAWRPGVPPPEYVDALVYDVGGRRLIALSYHDTWAYDGSGWVAVGDGAPPSCGAYQPATFDVARGRAVAFPCFGTWELVSGQWLPGGTMEGVPERQTTSLAYDALRERIVLVGGSSYISSFAVDVWISDGATWTRDDPDRGPPARWNALLTFDAARNDLFLYGGKTQKILEDFLEDTWLHDGALWRPSPSVPAPPMGILGTMGIAHDARRGVTVLVSGVETWEHDATTWTRRSDVPTDRGPIAFDVRRNRTVRVDTSARATWEYDGTSWTAALAPPPAYGSRDGVALTYDGARSVLVLFGGVSSGTYRADTWEYDGTSWRQGAAAPPALQPRAHAQLAYDSRRHRSILFSGSDFDTTFTDTWEHDGQSWLPGPPAPPSMPLVPAIAYDARRGVVVAFGGSDTRAMWEYVRGDTPAIVVGPGAGHPNPNRLRVFDRSGAPTPVDVTVYAAGHWGTNVATADLDLGGSAEILAAPGPGPIFGPQVRAFTRDGAPLPVSFYAYGTLRYGANPSSGQIDGDAFDEILVGPGRGSIFGPHVRAFDAHGARDIAPVAGVSFFAYPFAGYGVNVGSSDAGATGFDQILTGPGPAAGHPSLVRGFSFEGVALRTVPGLEVVAFPGAGYGVRIAGGDVDADGDDEVAAGRGAGPVMSAEVRGFALVAGTLAALPGFDVTPFPGGFGVQLSLGDLDDDGAAELLAGAGPNGTTDARVASFTYDGARLVPVAPTFDAFPGLRYGVCVAHGRLGL